MNKKIVIQDIRHDNKVGKTSGKAYVSCNIKAVDGNWYSGFGNKVTTQWASGDTIEIDVEEKNVNGKVFLNFKTLDKASVSDELVGRVEKLEKALELLLKDKENLLEYDKSLPF